MTYYRIEWLSSLFSFLLFLNYIYYRLCAGIYFTEAYISPICVRFTEGLGIRLGSLLATTQYNAILNSKIEEWVGC